MNDCVSRGEPTQVNGCSGLRTVLVALAVATVSAGAIQSLRAPGPDYLQFWAIGRAMPLPAYGALHGREIPREWTTDSAIARAREAGSKKLYLTATPLYYALFAVTSTADFSRSLRLFQLVSAAIFVVGVVLLLRAWGYSADAICVVVTAYFLWSAPLHNDASYANISRLYVGLVALLLCVMRSRHFVVRSAGAHAFVGVLVVFKPILALACPALLLLRMIAGRWRTAAYEVAGFGGGVALGVALPTLLVSMPITLWTDFIAIQLHYLEDGDYQARTLGDASVVETLTAALGLSFVQFALLLCALMLIAAIGVMCAATRRRRRHDDGAEIDDAELSVLLSGTVFLAVSPLVWPHYYLLATVLALRLLRAAPAAARPWGRVASTSSVVALVLLAASPLAAIIGWSLPPGTFEPGDVINVQLALGGVIVCVCGVVEYGRRIWWANGNLVPARAQIATS